MPTPFLLGVLAQAVAASIVPVDTTAAQPSSPLAQSEAPASAGAPMQRPEPTPIGAEPPAPQWRPRRFGVHLGINATFTFDVSAGRIWYFGATTQLTGLAWLASTERNFNVSLLAFGGVGLPVIEHEGLRFTVDVAPALTYTHAAPVNLLSVGLLAGVRLVHRSGFTFAVKLPLVGYAGAPDAQRGGLLMYYTNAIITVPAITFGYSF